MVIKLHSRHGSFVFFSIFFFQFSFLDFPFATRSNVHLFESVKTLIDCALFFFVVVVILFNTLAARRQLVCYLYDRCINMRMSNDCDVKIEIAHEIDPAPINVMFHKNNLVSRVNGRKMCVKKSKKKSNPKATKKKETKNFHSEFHSIE